MSRSIATGKKFQELGCKPSDFTPAGPPVHCKVSHCELCGTAIKIAFPIKNKSSGQILWVGSDCIKNFLFSSWSEAETSQFKVTANEYKTNQPNQKKREKFEAENMDFIRTAQSVIAQAKQNIHVKSRMGRRTIEISNQLESKGFLNDRDKKYLEWAIGSIERLTDAYEKISAKKAA